MMLEKTKLAFLCFVSQKSIPANLEKVDQLCIEAKAKGAQWVFLPEMWTHQTSNLEEFRALSLQAATEVLPKMQTMAKTYQLFIFAGSWTQEAKPLTDKFFNTQFVIDPKGEVLASYQKIHLFKMDDGSLDPYRETKKFVPGNAHKTCKVGSWNVGLSTCFDVRFPEMYRWMSRLEPLDIITVPSAFLRSTGQDHWEILLRARAIENQSYVIASNRIGKHDDPRIESYFGHSMVVDPWGKVVLDTQDQEGVFVTEIDPEVLQKVRKLLPLFSVRSHKQDLYK